MTPAKVNWAWREYLKRAGVEGIIGLLDYDAQQALYAMRSTFLLPLPVDRRV